MRPGISLVDNAHLLKHEKTQVLARLGKLCSKLGINGASLADEGWSSVEMGVTESMTSREMAAKRFTNTNTP